MVWYSQSSPSSHRWERHARLAALFFPLARDSRACPGRASWPPRDHSVGVCLTSPSRSPTRRRANANYRRLWIILRRALASHTQPRAISLLVLFSPEPSPILSLLSSQPILLRAGRSAARGAGARSFGPGIFIFEGEARCVVIVRRADFPRRKLCGFACVSSLDTLLWNLRRFTLV